MASNSAAAKDWSHWASIFVPLVIGLFGVYMAGVNELNAVKRQVAVLEAQSQAQKDVLNKMATDVEYIRRKIEAKYADNGDIHEGIL